MSSSSLLLFVSPPPPRTLPHHHHSRRRSNSRASRETQKLHAYTHASSNDPSSPPPPLPSTKFSINRPSSSSHRHSDDLDQLLSVFHRTARPSPFLYNSLIRALNKNRLPDHALAVFCRMLDDPAALPDRFTFPFVLKSCAQLSALEEGEQIHGWILKTLHIFEDEDDAVFINNSLVYMYSQCGKIVRAHQLFDKMPIKNAVSWNSMIDGFGKSGDVDSARRFFDKTPEKNIIAWNSMIGGYVQNGLPDESLGLFCELMCASGLMPDESTMVSVVSAISDMDLLSLGKRAHGYTTRLEFPLDGALGVSLINMYTRCGSVSSALQVFSGIPNKNVGHWTSIIVGFAAHGFAEDSLRLFTEMLSSGVKPNHVTFVGVLSACSHGGLVEEGIEIFNLMRSYGVEPRIQHHGCLVDLLGRAGFIEEALVLISNLPGEPGSVIWSALLAACRNHGNIEIAEAIAHKLIELKPDCGGCYVLLSNIYAGSGRWEDFSRIRKTMEDRGVEKVTGFSWIEVDGGIHDFVAEDKLHPKHGEIYSMLDKMEYNLRWAGYRSAASTSSLSNNNTVVEEM